MELQYERNDINFTRNKFRVRGDVVEIFPSYSSDTAIRVEFFGDEIDRISEINTVTGEVKNVVCHVAIYPASHYIVPREKMQRRHSTRSGDEMRGAGAPTFKQTTS